MFDLGTLKNFKRNPLYFANCTKYSVPYPALGFEIHYSVNEVTRQCLDVKITPPFKG